MAELDVRRTEVLRNLAKIIQCKFCSYIAWKEFLAFHNDAIDLQALWRGIPCSCICRSVGSKCLCILSIAAVCWNYFFFHVKSCEITMYIFYLSVFFF